LTSQVDPQLVRPQSGKSYKFAANCRLLPFFSSYDIGNIQHAKVVFSYQPPPQQHLKVVFKYFYRNSNSKFEMFKPHFSKNF